MHFELIYMDRSDAPKTIKGYRLLAHHKVVGESDMV